MKTINLVIVSVERSGVLNRLSHDKFNTKNVEACSKYIKSEINWVGTKVWFCINLLSKQYENYNKRND